MHDIKLSELFPVTSWKPLLDAALNIKSPACRKAENEFRENMGLVNSLAMVPGYSFMNGENWGISVVRAMNELNSTNPDAPEVATLAGKIFDKYDTGAIDQSKIDHFYEASANAGKIACLPNRHLSRGALIALLKSLIIQSWSAFELMAEKLHKSVREHHPNLFTPELLSGKYGFRTERQLPPSYATLFGGDASINSSAWNSDIKAHAILRHLLIHSHGKVDDGHLMQRKKPPIVKEWDAFNLGDEITLDGGLVRRILDRTTKAAYNLMLSVSQWIDKHTT